MKRTIRLSENKLHNIIKESVKRILRENTMKLNEYGDTPKGQYMLGRLQARKGNKTWAPSWVASEERDNAASEAEKQGKSYNITHNNMLRAYRDGINGVQWNESLNRLIKESVKSILREYQFDNDIDYTSIYEQALDLLSGCGEPSGYGWRDVAEAMGFRLDSLGPNDMETMQDAIEDAMMETSGFANEARFRNFVKESVNSVLREGFEKPSNWTDTPYKGTYQDETGALYMPDDDFEDEPGYYKGYHLEMDNNDPSFPHYQIISPNGEPCGSAWTFTDMQEYVDGLGQ